ncbi:MAG: FtsB family cell division protein [Actinomycetota bacterium]
MITVSRTARWIGGFVLITIALALLTTAVPFRQIIDQRARVEAARSELAALAAQNEALAAEVEALTTPAEIERLARAKLGFVMPGETAYVVLEPEPLETNSATDPAPIEPAPAWWRTIWDFFTGQDLSGT